MKRILLQLDRLCLKRIAESAKARRRAIETYCQVMPAIHVHFARLWYLACEARDRCRELESREGRPLAIDAVVAVVMSVAACEAFINEMTAIAASRTYVPQPDAVVSFVAILQQAVEARTDLGIKYQLAASALTGRPFDRGRAPYQDFADLIRLRNWYIHLSQREPGVLKRFEQEGRTYPHPTFLDESGEERPVGMSGVDLLATFAIAEWACDTSHRVIWAMLGMFPDGPTDPAKLTKMTFPSAIPMTVPPPDPL